MFICDNDPINLNLWSGFKGRYTPGLLQHAPGAKLPLLHQRFLAKNMLHNKTFAPEFCFLISNWFDMREQAQGANLLHKSVSGASVKLPYAYRP